MSRGGDANRHDNLIVIGGLYGSLQIVLAVALLGLAIRRDRSSLLSLGIGAAAYIAVFVAMVATYAADMANVPNVLQFFDQLRAVSTSTAPKEALHFISGKVFT